MRWGYLVPRLVLVAILWSFFAFGFDPLMHRGLVAGAEQAAGARVEIGDLSTRFFPPGLVLNQVCVANRFRPGRNLVEFSDMAVRLRGDALLRRRFVIDDGVVSGVRIGTERDDDGLLPEDEGGESALAPWMKKFEELGSAWLDDLVEQAQLEMDPEQLETWQVSQRVHRKWRSRLRSFRKRVAEMEPRAKQIERLASDASKQEPLAQVQAWGQVATDANTLWTDADGLTRELAALPAELRVDFNEINAARLRDQQRVRSKLDLLKPDPARITESLLGRELTARLEEVLVWSRAAHEYAVGLRVDEKPERRRGRDILFPVMDPQPGFLLRQLRVNGDLQMHNEVMPFKALIGGVTSDPVLHGKPVELRLEAKGSSGLSVRGQFDYTGEVPVNTIVLTTHDGRPSETQLGQPDRLAIGVVAGATRWNCQLRLTGDELSGGVQLQQTGVTLRGQGKKLENPIVSRVVAGVLETVDALDATLQVSGTLTRPRLAVSSPLGQQLADGVQASLMRELDVQQAELAQRADKIAREEIQRVQQRLSEQYTKLIGEHKHLVEHVQLVKSLVPAGGGRPRASDVIRSVSRSRVVNDKVDEAIRKSGTAEKIRSELNRFGGLGGFLPGGDSRDRQQRR